MQTIHCHFCGGIIRNPATIQYRPPRASAQFALPQNGLCSCTPPIVYEDSPLDAPRVDEEQVERVEPVKRVERRQPDAPARPNPSDPWKGAA